MATENTEKRPHWKDRIVKDPQILGGKPVVRGMRISVELITDLLVAGDTKADIMLDYPDITSEDIEACIQYKATGAKLSYVTWADIDAWMDEGESVLGDQ